jgi:predicted permease
MNWFAQLSKRRRLFSDLSEEIQQHLTEKIEALMADGMSREDAEYTARREFGNITRVEERSRQAWIWPTLENTLADLKLAFRKLGRSPGFTSTAVLTLALAIGATTAMYSIVRSTLLSPLPYKDQEQLVGVGFSRPGESPNNEQTGETGDLLLANSISFSSMGIADDGALGANFLDKNGSARVVRSLRVSSGYLPTLGIVPLLGRTFSREEDLPGAAPTVVLSENLWRHTLNADPQIIDSTIHINGDPFTVIGVMPGTLATIDTPDLWQPIHLSSADPGYGGDNFQVVARLKPAVSVGQASAELEGITAEIYRKFPSYLQWGRPGTPKMQEFVWPLQQIVVSGARSSLLALSAAVLAVLLMACLNLAGLMIARSALRRAEIGLRSALGASRSSLLRLLLVEGLVLSFAGSLLGLILSHFIVPILLTSSPIDLPQLQKAEIDVPVAAFAIAIGCITTLFFGILPAISLFRRNSSSQLGGARTAGESSPRQRVGKSLIVAQVALASTLLSVGAVLLGAFLHMRSIPPGVRPQHLFALQVNLKGDAYASSRHTQQFIAAVEERLRRIPGIVQVATVNGLPLDRGLNMAGGPANHRELIKISEARFVTPGYFRTVGTTILVGTDISESDTAKTQRVALINERAAKLWFSDRSPIGEYVISGGGEPRRVVGLVANVHDSSLAAGINPTIYVPYSQVEDKTMKAINGWFVTTFVLRTAERANVAESDIAKASEAAITSVDPEVPASKFATMQSFIDRNVAAPRFFSWLAGAFATFALLLTLIGLFGLLSYQVASRTREIGVRMALGAQRSTILNLVLRNGLTLTILGLCVGTVTSLILRRSLTSLIADTTRIDSAALSSILASPFASIGIMSGTMLASSIAACLIPARRAASIEPTEALRAE